MSFLSSKNKPPLPLLSGSTALPSPLYSLDRLASIADMTQVITLPANSICLTFDDGPHPVYTAKILAVLADFDAKATFFVLGQAASQFPHLVEQIIKAGHAIGNHTYSHRHPWLMSSVRAQLEVTQTNSIIKEITGTAPRWFRPPFGRLRTAMRLQAQTEQMTTVLWSHSVMDWGVFGTRAGISKRLTRIKPRDIVLLHDGRPAHNSPDMTSQCLPQFLRTIADQLFIAQSLDEVFSEHK